MYIKKDTWYVFSNPDTETKTLTIVFNMQHFSTLYKSETTITVIIVSGQMKPVKNDWLDVLFYFVYVFFDMSVFF